MVEYGVAYLAGLMLPPSLMGLAGMIHGDFLNFIFLPQPKIFFNIRAAASYTLLPLRLASSRYLL